MLRLILNRLALGLITVALASAIIFGAIEALPGEEAVLDGGEGGKVRGARKGDDADGCHGDFLRLSRVWRATR